MAPLPLSQVDPRSAGREEVRESAKTRSWERAEAKLRQMEEAAHYSNRKADRKVTIKEAVEAFLEDEHSRHLCKTTTGQSKTLLEQQLMPWAEQQSLRFLDELTAPFLSKFRATWANAGNNANTARRKHQRLSGFLWFCVRNEWLERNPARMLKAIRMKQVPPTISPARNSSALLMRPMLT